MPPDNGTVLEVRSLRIESYARGNIAPLLDDIHLSLASGEVLGLIGESGAGKSTLGLAAMGYMREGCAVTAGDIFFHGENLFSFSRERLRRLRGAHIAYVAQSPASAFNPSQTLRNQVAEVLVLHKGYSKQQAALRVVDLFAEMSLPSPATFGQYYPHQVSGGQLQRAMIAMAIACQPRLLILDEPTTALDVTTQVEVLAAIRNTLKKHEISALYISHDLAVVAQIADRLLVLRHGKMVESGSTATLISTPESAYTHNLMEAFSSAPRQHPDRATQEHTSALLEVEGLTASYQSMPQVLNNVSCSLCRGKTLAVVGMSGSGKSTLARAVCGIVQIDAGQVRFHQQVLPPSYLQRSRAQLRAIQMVYQQPDTALNPQQSVGDIIGRGLALHSGMSKAAIKSRIAEVLEMVALPANYAARKPGMLSGGQKQRVGIARALAASPELIICDEITSALDPLVAVDILELLRDIQNNTGTSYLMITHDFGVVRRMADDVLVMRQGAIVEQGTLVEVFEHPEHPYTKALLASVPELHTDWLANIAV